MTLPYLQFGQLNRSCVRLACLVVSKGALQYRTMAFEGHGLATHVPLAVASTSSV